MAQVDIEKNHWEKQLEKELAEKFEMFEIMKAQIEYDKEYVLKLETGVETQRSMIEAIGTPHQYFVRRNSVQNTGG